MKRELARPARDEEKREDKNQPPAPKPTFRWLARDFSCCCWLFASFLVPSTRKYAKAKVAGRQLQRAVHHELCAATVPAGKKLPSMGNDSGCRTGARCDVLKRAPKNAQAWLELGSLLCKAKEQGGGEGVSRRCSSSPRRRVPLCSLFTLGGDSKLLPRRV